MFVGISGVWCCFGGDWRVLVVYLGCNEIRSGLLVFFEDFSDSSAHAMSIQARANPHFGQTLQGRIFST